MESVQARPLERRNQRLLLVGVACYGLLVSTLMLQGGVAVTPDVAVVALGLAGVLLLGGRLHLASWLPLVALLLAYELMRGLADDAGFPVHLEDMIVAERFLALGNIPTQVLQEALQPSSGLDWAAAVATSVYMIHFLVPILTGVCLWLWGRTHFHDYMAALILLSLAAFVTYLLFPAAPPWYVAEQGLLDGADGAPLIGYLKPEVFSSVAASIGFDGGFLYTSVFHGLGPNDVAAWPSLHVAYPFLAFLFLRRALGRIAWLACGYTLLVALSVVYTGDHWLHDTIAGAAYAYVAYYVIVHTPQPFRLLLDRAFAGPRRRRALVGEAS
jgi:membrane-associated phospholipid phosphatase